MYLPSGKGWFARGDSLSDDLAFCDTIGATHIALDVARAGGAARRYLAERGKPKGLKVLATSTPEAFRPSTWRQGLALMHEVADAYDLDGVLVNPEEMDDRWLPGTKADATAFSRGIESVIKSGISVGVVSVPSWRFRDILGESGCYGMVEMYLLRTHAGATSPDERIAGESMRQTMRRYHSMWAPHFYETTFALAAWNRSELEQRAYLAAVPDVRAATFWNTQVPRELAGALREYEPRPFSPGAPPQSAPSERGSS